VLEFTVAAARVHAEIHAELAKKGQMIGAHDLIIAATACCHDLSMLTDNVQEFSRVPGLRVIPFIP
jgi:tRNA(fMet)-specific endonuclease VapC